VAGFSKSVTGHNEGGEGATTKTGNQPPIIFFGKKTEKDQKR
jgi:hypothetical protein